MRPMSYSRPCWKGATQRRWESFRGDDTAAQAAWLRQILARNLANAVRDLTRAKRDVRKERALQIDLDASASQLEGWLAADQSSPSQKLERHERTLQLAEALAQLPEAQRDAVVLRHFQGLPLADIAEQLDCTTAMPGHRTLAPRGLKNLRKSLTDLENSPMAMNHRAKKQLDAILHSYLQAVDAGQNPDREELLRRHPDLADELRAFFADQAKMDSMALALNKAHAGDITLGAEETSNGLPRIRYFGDYELLEEIARGGMGVVWKARQTSLKRDVALKMIRAGALARADEVERFCEKPRPPPTCESTPVTIVAIHEVGEHDGQHYFSMDYVAGRDLGAVVKDGPLTPQIAARYVKISRRGDPVRPSAWDFASRSEAAKRAHRRCRSAAHHRFRPGQTHDGR